VDLRLLATLKLAKKIFLGVGLDHQKAASSSP
jgi:hypothetical protein